MALACVSVLRGSGKKAGISLIDDHSKVNDTDFEYLTRYSETYAGDFDPGRSSYTVSQLKTVYKKLFSLVCAGVAFVGHGLKKKRV